VSNYPLVQAGFGAPQRQRRLKVAFRLILASPLILWGFLLSIAAGFLIVIGWFAALILGRLPRGFVQPLTDYIVFITRLYSYLYLMNDAYPPYSANKDFVVNVEISDTKVRRLAVLFRIILLVPVAVVSALATGGVAVAAFFIWLIVLVKGEVPPSLFAALAAVLRYQARFYAYYMMLTSKYPGELFGDQPAPIDSSWTSAGAPSSIPPLDGTPVGFAMSETAAQPLSEPTTSIVAAATDGAEPAVAPGAPLDAPMAFAANESLTDHEVPPRTARLVLSKASKNILVLFLVLGVVSQVGQRLLDGRLLNNETALTRVINANNLLNSEIASAKSQKKNCSLGANACLQQYFSAIDNAFNAIQVTFANTNFPASAQADAHTLDRATVKLVADIDGLKPASITQAQANQLQTLGNAFDTDFNQVIADLRSPT
jgi:hypothetical protein